MAYLIIGAVIALTGAALMRNELGFIGAIIFMIGLALALKGRSKLDKK